MAEPIFRIDARAAKRAIGIIIVTGLVLRIVAGAGDVWLDEAWSAVFARRVAPVWGVFFSINHDNNHHLITLWFQLVGKAAPPLVLRAPAIVASTAAIGVAAAFAWRRGLWPALVTALLFALAPAMILYGSEARGYGLFALAILTAIFVTDGWLDQPEAPPPADLLALIAGLGIFSHLMMAPAMICVAGWVWCVRLTQVGWRQATRESFAALAPALIVTAAAMAIVLGGAALVGGMTFGGQNPFSYGNIGIAMTELAGLASGFGRYGEVSWTVTGIYVALLLALAVAPPRMALKDTLLTLLLVLPLPLMALLLHPANAEYSRYFLIVTIGLLLFAGMRTGAMIERGGAARVAAILAIAAMSGGALNVFSMMVVNGRGHSSRAVAAIAARQPQGAIVQLVNERERSVLEVTAAQRSFPLRIVDDHCEPAAQFLLLDRAPGKVVAPRTMRCGGQWQAIRIGTSIGPSGQNWALYAKSARAAARP